ncbi:MAG: M14 family metallopeptidase [Bacteroidales bacterium]|nr:M14 family metallopeptidase [Bacteroidales bacterium]
MKKVKQKVLLLFVMAVFIYPAYGQSYRNATELNTALNRLAKQNPAKVKVHKLGETFSGLPFLVLEIGTETKTSNKKKPAIFVLGNPDGTIPLGSEAALKLAEDILANSKTERFTWYIVPSLNPEALNHYFEKVKFESMRNLRPHNDDMDDAVDEDGPDDLNGDGYITQMRVLDPTGTYIVDKKDPRIMRKADYAKGEKGMYKLYTEGIDNDGDGKYNEDPQGGTNNNRNFPHLFQAYQATSGIWPGSENEVYALMQFITKHTEIAAIFTFGAVDWCIQTPKGGRKGNADFSKIKIPKRFAKQFGADPNRSYTMNEIIEMVQPMMPEGMELTPSMVAGFLGLGAVVNPLKEDLAFYKELNEQYKEYLKKQNINLERLAPQRAQDGSFELWSYYQIGVPTFPMSFFTVAKPVKEKQKKQGLSLEQLDKMTNKEFIALGEDSINTFLKNQGAPKQFNAKRIIAMLESGDFTTKKIAEMMKQMPKKAAKDKIDEKTLSLLAYSDKELKGKGFVKWTKYQHPTLGEVEIGGFIPYLENTPKAELIDSLIMDRLPWIYTLTGKLAKLSITKHEQKNLGEGIYQLKVWVSNTNYLPFPSNMGNRNKHIPPAVLSIKAKGIEMISGKQRTPIDFIGGNKTLMFKYMIKAPKGSSLQLELVSPNAGNDSKQIKL